MKKAFFAICAILPGGFFLLAAVLLFVGCAYTDYNQKTGERTVRGYGSIMEIAAAERLQADAYAVKRCADDPRNCGGMWSYGGLYMPAGYGWSMQATGTATNPANISSVEKKLDEVVKETRTTKEGLKEFFRSRSKNSQRVKNAQ